MVPSRFVGVALALCAFSCAHQPPPWAARSQTPPGGAPQEHAAVCGNGHKLRVHFYNVGQALSALVELPDGKHILVDAGDKHAASTHHLLDKLRADLKGRPLDVLWITHQHSDHLGGAPDVLTGLLVRNYVDNGTDGPPERGHASNDTPVARTRAAARNRGVPLSVVDPTRREPPIASTDEYSVHAFVPAAWGSDCAAKPNNCSIGLRIDFCASSVLFTGDAEEEEENHFSDRRHADLLQVGHHGSQTSSSHGFIAAISPKYAVISAGKPRQGMNATYCHPRKPTVERLTALLGGPEAGRVIESFAGMNCRGHDGRWEKVPASGRLWATEVDGDILVETTGNGVFVRIVPSS